MRILVAISSCQGFEDAGLNTPLRETWLPDAKALGMDYKFFHGSGANPKEDVVVLNVVDELYGLTEKLKGKCRWAIEQGYDYIFSCFPDTYTCPERLLEIIKTQPDYLGNAHQFTNSAAFAQGGPGYILNKKACEILSNDPSSYLNDDCWASDVLYAAGIKVVHNKNFTPFGPGPRKDNTSVTVHLSTQPCGYNGENLRQAHRDWINS